jgi:hypothetical protein
MGDFNTDILKITSHTAFNDFLNSLGSLFFHPQILQPEYTARITDHSETLRGSPCKNRPLEFRKITEFLQTFCVEEVIHKMNKKR